MGRIVLHMDLDYFFAQVEESDRPEYLGRPVVVCIYSGRDTTSGVVSTSNYEARRYGVKSGLPIRTAMRKLKGTDAAFIPARHERYAEVSQKVMETLARYGEKFEYVSIDEGVLEITKASDDDYGKAERIALAAKQEIREKTGLTCSIGVGPNRLIAKIASDFRKPDGLTVVKPDEVEGFLAEMDVGKIPGVGAKTREVLNAAGIRTIAQLRDAEPGFLAEAFGKKTGGWLINAARGIDESEVGAQQGEQKQISRIMTLKRDTRDVDEIMDAMEELIRDIGKEVLENKLTFRAVGASVVDETLRTHSKSRTLPRPAEDAAQIGRAARELFAAIAAETKTAFRRAGVKVEGLASAKGQKTLGEY